MNLAFTLDDEDDILNVTIRDSETDSVVYTVETPKYIGGTFTTTARRRHQSNGTTRFLFRFLWKGARGSLEDVMVVLDPETWEEVPVREVLQSAPGVSTYGSLVIQDVEYRWKSKGMGSKIVLVNHVSNEIVAESHSRVRSSFFKKPRAMSLEISDAISLAMDIVLLTFILVWRERQSERSKDTNILITSSVIVPRLSLLPVEG